MFIANIQHTPAWVWGALAVLMALGLWQTRDRQMSLPRITALPLLLLVLSLTGVYRAFGHSAIALGAWAAGVVTTLALTRNAIRVRGAAWSPGTRTLHVPGSWLPLALILGLFAVKYFTGYSLALNPARATDAAFAGLCSLAYGGFSGLFTARALSLRGLATRASPVQPA